ncbi:hypothetical protein QFZ76_000783 [Streptomyces sp. V4I2]|nr:hypothetical protein [Streptomyces sp. V4I2]
MTTFKRHRGLTEQAADIAVDQAFRMLRLPTIRAQFPELAEAAARDHMSYRGFLAELLRWPSETTGLAAVRNDGSRPPPSPVRNHCGPSTSTPTPAWTRRSSTPW